ncbi:integrase core domain-containing protein, partial [Neisseria sp. P0001.S004]
ANHAFGVACYENGIGQKFTRVARPQTNGKAERVIRTLMETWHEKQLFDSPEHRRKELCRFVNFYNTVKPHRSLNGDTPFEVLQRPLQKSPSPNSRNLNTGFRLFPSPNHS